MYSTVQAEWYIQAVPRTAESLVEFSSFVDVRIQLVRLLYFNLHLAAFAELFAATLV